MGWYDTDPGWAGWLMMTLGMAGFWALVVGVVVAVLRSARSEGPGPGSRPRDPRELLDERLARGEIDAADYQVRRDLISGPEAPSRGAGPAPV